MIHNQHCNIYIASCEENGGIYRCRIHKDGIPYIESFAPMDKPMYMTISDGKMYVLLRAPFQNSSDSGLIIYDIGSDGNLTNPSEIYSTKGEVACHLAVDHGDVFCTNYISGSIVKMWDKVVSHSGKGVNPYRQQSPHPHFVCLTPDKKYICVTDLGVDKVLVYNKDLTLKSIVNIPDGSGPRHLVFHENGRNAFCVNELTSTVTVMSYRDGTFEVEETVRALPPTDCESTAAAIRCRDNMVFVSNRGHNSISFLEFCDDSLTLKKTVPSYGQDPRDFWIENDLIISANEKSNHVSFVSMRNDCLLNNLNIKKPVCVVVN